MSIDVNNIVVIGSYALNHYVESRDYADVDIIVHKDFPVDVDKLRSYFNKPVEVTVVYDGMSDISSYYVWQYAQYKGIKKSTEIGTLIIPPKTLLKCLKLSCVDFLGKIKHNEDLKLLSNVRLSKTLKKLTEIRITEVHRRTTKQKVEFFNKYNITRFVEHDVLHKLLNPSPLYEGLLVDAVTPSESLFIKLDRKTQEQIVFEECFVLALERWVLPNIHEYPYKIVNILANFQTNTSIQDAWIDIFSGTLKDHPRWLADWTFKNQKTLKTNIRSWWAVSSKKKEITDFILKVSQVTV
jgi:hypothetical protein